MALAVDRDGFLVGERVDIDTREKARTLELLRSIASDMRDVRRLLAGQGGMGRQNRTGVARTSLRAPGSARPARVRQPVSESVKLSAPVATTPQRRPQAPAMAAPRLRDSRGKFIGKADRPRLGAGGGGAPAGGQDRSEPENHREPRDTRERGRLAKIAAEAAKDGAIAAAAGTSQVDPMLAAAKEIGAPLAAVGKVVGGGLFDSWKDRAERRKEKRAAKETAKETVKAQIPWFRRIIGASGGDVAGGGGLLSGLIGMGGGLSKGVIGGAVGGLVTRMLGGMRGAVAPLRSVKFAGLLRGGLGKSLLPIGAIMSALDSFNTSTEDYAKRLGTETGGSIAKGLVVRLVGVMQDLGNALTLGLADKASQWISKGLAAVRGPAKPTAKPAPVTKPVSTDEPASTGNGGAIPATGAGSLLDLIGSKEAGAAGYDAFWNGSRVKPAKPMSQMTLGEVRQWQSATLNEQASRGVKQSRRSSAAGRYQFMSGTLPRMMKAAGLKDSDPFNAENQDKLAMALLDADKNRGLSAWRSGRASDSQFADYVASQWASFKNSSGVGQYDAPGFNKATAGAGDVLSAARAMPSGRRGSALPTAAPTLRSSSPATRSTAAPSMKQMALPPPPPEQTKIGSSRRGKDAVEVNIAQPLGQNVSDRGIAQLATGGMGGGIQQRMA